MNIVTNPEPKFSSYAHLINDIIWTNKYFVVFFQYFLFHFYFTTTTCQKTVSKVAIEQLI